MKRLLTVALLLLAVVALPAQEVVTFMPQWLPQTQFAGYYVALEKGFYAEEGLDVIVDHFGGSSTGTALEKIEQRKVDIITSQLISVMIERERGMHLINVLQTSQINGLMCATHFPITSPASLDSALIGRWKVGFGEVCDLFCYKHGLHVEWVPYIQGINLFISGAVDGLLCYSYSEFLQLELATGGIREDHRIRFSDYGLNYPEDGLYVTEEFYRNHKSTVDKFVRASRRGWEYAREHKEEALDISMKVIAEFNVATNRTFQRLMLDEILRLQVNPLTDVADYAPVRREVFEELNRSLIEAKILKAPQNYEEMIR